MKVSLKNLAPEGFSVPHGCAVDLDLWDIEPESGYYKADLLESKWGACAAQIGVFVAR